MPIAAQLDLHRPARPALRYFGGKWRLAPWVIGHLPPHRCYVEPFGGGASVLLRKDQVEVEVYNDLAGAVVNFFRVLRDRGEELVAKLQLTPFALDEYAASREPTDDPVEAARRFFVRSWGGHSGVEGCARRDRGWRRTPDRDVARQMARTVDEALVTAARRLRGVAIDCKDYREVLEAYDTADTLFYVDPPYVQSSRARWNGPSDGYGAAYEMDDDGHRELLERLLRLRGRVVVSGYPSEMYDAALKGWARRERTSALNASSGRATEVLWIKGGDRG